MLVAAWCDFESACDIYLLKKNVSSQSIRKYRNEHSLPKVSSQTFVRYRLTLLTCSRQWLKLKKRNPKLITLTLLFYSSSSGFPTPRCSLVYLYPWTLEPIVCSILSKRFIGHTLVCNKYSHQPCPLSNHPHSTTLSLSTIFQALAHLYYLHTWVVSGEGPVIPGRRCRQGW